MVLSSAGTARALTVGGPIGTTELELSGATLALGSNSTVGPTGAVVITSRLSTVQVQHRAVLTNHGIVTIRSPGLQLEGNLTNAPNGSLEIDDSLGWKGSGYGGSFGLVGPSKFKNEGTVWIQQNANIEAPYNGSYGAVIDNAGGVIANAGNIAVGTGATFVEGNGKVIGSDTGDYNVVQVKGGTLDLVGDGASTFQLAGSAKIAGTVAPDQVLVTFSSPDLTTLGSVTNEGIIATQYASATITVPPNSTLYNAGTVQAVHGNSLIVAGRMENLASGDIDVAGGTFGLERKSVFINNGTITVTGTGSFEAPEVGAVGSIFDNARGNITNEGSFQVVNGTFVEGAGAEAGAPVHSGGDGGLARTILWPFIQGTGTAWRARQRTTPSRSRRTPQLCTSRPVPGHLSVTSPLSGPWSYQARSAPIANRGRNLPGPGWRPVPRCHTRLYRPGRHAGSPHDHGFVARGGQRGRPLPRRRQLRFVELAARQ